MKTRWHFPLIDPGHSHSIKHYLDHIKEEIKEFEEEKDPERKLKEAVDVLHAAETFVRKLFRGNKFQSVKKAVIKKNKSRVYY